MIAIKDIKMPVNCEECFARLLSWCRLDEEERMVIPALPDESFEGRPDWCPMVEIPDEAGNCSEIPNNSDSVSRQTAVEAIANQSRFSAEEIINICDKSVQDENGWLGGLKEAIQAVIELPSVQSEIIMCKDCRFRIDGNCYVSNFKGGLPCMIRWVKANDFCSMAERKNDD